MRAWLKGGLIGVGVIILIYLIEILLDNIFLPNVKTFMTPIISLPFFVVAFIGGAVIGILYEKRFEFLPIKFALMGLVLYILFLIIYVFFHGEDSYIFRIFGFVPMYLMNLLVSPMAGGMGSWTVDPAAGIMGLFLLIIFFPLFGFGAGALIGWIVSKVKSKK